MSTSSEYYEVPAQWCDECNRIVACRLFLPFFKGSSPARGCPNVPPHAATCKKLSNKTNKTNTCGPCGPCGNYDEDRERNGDRADPILMHGPCDICILCAPSTCEIAVGIRYLETKCLKGRPVCDRMLWHTNWCEQNYWHSAVTNCEGYGRQFVDRHCPDPDIQDEDEDEDEETLRARRRFRARIMLPILQTFWQTTLIAESECSMSVDYIFLYEDTETGFVHMVRTVCGDPFEFVLGAFQNKDTAFALIDSYTRAMQTNPDDIDPDWKQEDETARRRAQESKSTAAQLSFAVLWGMLMFFHNARSRRPWERQWLVENSTPDSIVHDGQPHVYLDNGGEDFPAEELQTEFERYCTQTPLLKAKCLAEFMSFSREE